MGYDVEFVDPVREYLDRVDGLADDDRTAIVDGIIEELSRHADRFLAVHPLGHESLSFRYNYPHLTGNLIYDFEFVVDASFLEMGVVRVVYVEHMSKPMS